MENLQLTELQKKEVAPVFDILKNTDVEFNVLAVKGITESTLNYISSVMEAKSKPEAIERLNTLYWNLRQIEKMTSDLTSTLVEEIEAYQNMEMEEPETVKKEVASN